MLDRAYISTIHAFCKRTLTEFFYLIDLDPTFGILDADEQRLLKTELLDKTLQEAWEDEALAGGLKVLFEGRRIQPALAPPATAENQGTRKACRSPEDEAGISKRNNHGTGASSNSHGQAMVKPLVSTSSAMLSDPKTGEFTDSIRIESWCGIIRTQSQCIQRICRFYRL